MPTIVNSDIAPMVILILGALVRLGKCFLLRYGLWNILPETSLGRFHLYPRPILNQAKKFFQLLFFFGV